MQILVGNRVYNIDSVDDSRFDASLLARGVSQEDVPGVKSFIDYDNQVILVRSRLQRDHRRELVTHELLHACLEDSGAVQTDEHEKFVRALAPRLHQLIDANLMQVLGSI